MSSHNESWREVLLLSYLVTDEETEAQAGTKTEVCLTLL